MTSESRPLSGVRVVDLGWITAGAGTSALLADLGADVLKVEGPGAIDPFRHWETPEAGVDWWNRSPYFAATNHDKRSLCLDLKSPQGLQVMLRLLEGADVLVENFRRGVLKSFGLDPNELRERFPRLVIASLSSQGESGPERDRISYGSTLEATSGLSALTGDGDLPVISGRDLNYPDQVVCLFAAGAVVAALVERARSGDGAHLDLAQRELTSFLLGEEVIAAAAGAPSERPGCHRTDTAERLRQEESVWLVEGADRTFPVRDASALVASPEFERSAAMGRTRDGRYVKGIPLAFSGRPLLADRPCPSLGADNRDALEEAGFSLEEIEVFQKAGIIASSPR